MGNAGSAPKPFRLHESAVEVMADAVIGTDAEYRVTLWNPAAERLYGYSAEEAMGRPARELATFEGDASRRQIEAGLNRDGIAHIEFRARTKSGHWRDIELIATAIRDQAGDPVGHLGIHRDVTERNRAELEHRRLAALVQASQDFIGVSDLEGRPLFLNEAGQRLVGISGMDELRSHHVADFFAPEERANLRDKVLPRLLEDGRQAWELDFINFRTGERIPVSWGGFRIDDPATGEPVALATITRDLRERRRAQEEIRDYRRQIDTVFASITDAFYGLDGDFRFSYINDRAVEVLGDLLGEDLSREDFLGNEVRAMFPGVVGTDTERNFRLALAERRTIAFEYLYPPRGRWFDIRVYPAGDGLAVYFVETSDRKAAEALRARHTRQQAAVAELGIRASRGSDALALMEEAVDVVARTLEVELVAVAELSQDGSRMLLRAGAGWEPGAVGTASASAGLEESLVGYAAATEAPIVCEDVRREDRCRPSGLLDAHEVISAAVVPIMGRRSPFGAFGVFSREPRRFDADEVNFLRGIAHVMHSAIERAQVARRLANVRDAERRRLARALHDETLQELGLALARAATPALGEDGIDHELVARLTRVGEQVRAAIHNLRLGESRDQSFSAQVAELVDLHRPRLPRIDCVVSAEVPDHPPRDVAHNFLRVIGEALTNAGRHASPSCVEVRVGLDGRALVAGVRDDGTGIDVVRPADLTGGHGIPGMRERAEVLGGELRLARPSGGGTLVELRVPLTQRRPADRARVLLVDDHAAMREAIALAFAQDDEFIVTGQAASLAEARGMLDGVDIAILDLELPDGDGADLIEDLRARNPTVQTLVLSAHADRASVARAVQKGAAAVLGKTTRLHEVVTAVRRMRAGETLMPLEEVVELLRFAGRQRERELDERRLIESLSPRELEVLQLLAAGLDSASIARRLHISPRTQRNHVANVLGKLEVHSQLQAVVFALRHGVVEVPHEPESV